MFTEKDVVVLCREVGDRSRVYMRPLININKRAYLTVRDDWYVWLGVDHLFLCEAQIFRVRVLSLLTLFMPKTSQKNGQQFVSPGLCRPVTVFFARALAGVISSLTLSALV